MGHDDQENLLDSEDGLVILGGDCEVLLVVTNFIDFADVVCDYCHRILVADQGG